jgi:hypothetical protein
VESYSCRAMNAASPVLIFLEGPLLFVVLRAKQGAESARGARSRIS